LDGFIMIHDRITPAIHILARLQKAGGEYISGRILAGEIGISTVAVWQYIQRFQREGFEIQGVRNRGYCLVSHPKTLHSDWLLALLHNRCPNPPDVHILDTVDSTMDEAARLLAHHRPTPFAIIAASQEAGRGRLGRRWHGDPGEGLLMTMAFRPEWPPNALRLYTPWMAVALADLFGEMGVPDLQVKWPNDLWTPRGKLAGVLVEARADTDRIASLTIGLGLNVNSSSDSLRLVSDRAATSLLLEAEKTFDLNRVAVDCIDTILRSHQDYGEASPGPGEAFVDRWNQLDLLRGKPITVTTAQGVIEGVALGMDDGGALLLKTEQGKLHRFHSGDAHLSAESLNQKG